MKLFLPNDDYSMGYEKCVAVLRTMGYQIHYSNPRTGRIKAIQESDEFPAAGIMDICLSGDERNVLVQLISGSVSERSGMIYYDETAELTFAEKLMTEVQPDLPYSSDWKPEDMASFRRPLSVQ